MKKKVFRERYANNVVSVETFEKHIEEPKVEVKKQPTKRGKKNDKSNK